MKILYCWIILLCFSVLVIYRAAIIYDIDKQAFPAWLPDSDAVFISMGDENYCVIKNNTFLGEGSTVYFQGGTTVRVKQ